MTKLLSKKEIGSLIEISLKAGSAIMDIYSTKFNYQIKNDNSPITKADEVSNDIICSSLKNLTPEIPILSEENSKVSFGERSLWKRYWLIDPLDGTKEFINRNGEFTVNIALIEESRPVFGIICLPINNRIYWGSEEYGSYSLDKENKKIKLNVSKENRGRITVVTSRSHPSKKLSGLLSDMNDPNVIKSGSSIKFCLVANGKADCYPRLNPTSEWDIAAGSAILKFAGGTIVDMNGDEIRYNQKDNFLVPNFLASTSRELAQQIIENTS